MYQWMLVMTMMGDTGNSEPVACDSAQSALPEVSCSMQTDRCLGEKHVGPSRSRRLSGLQAHD